MSSSPLPSSFALTFGHLSVNKVTGECPLNDVTGYVRTDGITAVIGRSGSGKSLLLSALSGRLDGLCTVTGTVTHGGRSVRVGSGEHSGFVGQEDALIGDLTVRETFTFSAQLGAAGAAADSGSAVAATVDAVIGGFHLSDVQHSVVGTVLKRGLSGGEKRRTSVGAVVCSRPDVLLLDEPTSGLDAAIAYQVLLNIKATTRANNMGVLMSIHQPSRRLLELIDDLIIIDRGHVVYGGPVDHSIDYFQTLGCPCPALTTPTDYFLHVITTKTPDVEDDSAVPSAALSTSRAPIDFINEYKQSALADSVAKFVDAASNTARTDSDSTSRYAVGLFQQMIAIAVRSGRVGTRDMTLYFFQMNMAAMFAFMVGALFFKIPREIGPRLQDYSNGIVWLTMIAAYLQVFKMYYLFTTKNRFIDEHANNLYSGFAWFISDLTVTSFFVFVTTIPTLLIAYGMMAFPNDAIGYTIFVLFVVALCSESLMGLLCQLTNYLPTAILLGQGSLVITCVYAGGAFIVWSQLDFWVWLSDISLFTYSTRGIMINVYKHIQYTCPTEYLATDGGSCLYNGFTFPCDAGLDGNGQCSIEGSTVLRVFKGVGQTDEWVQLGVLIALTVAFRLLTQFFLQFPVMRILQMLLGQGLTTVGYAQKALRGDSAKDSRPVLVTMTSMRLRAFANGNYPALSFHDIKLKLNDKTQKILVDGVNGEARAGRILAVMGPSQHTTHQTQMIDLTVITNNNVCCCCLGGAGKTTFLNAVSGRAPYATISGSVLLGSEPLTLDHVHYVPQFDTLNPAFTVSQTFATTVQLQRADIADAQTIIDEVLPLLGLTEHANTLVGELNSGVRKRVSIGVGILSKPPVLLLDEPTTGLDSETSLTIMDYLLSVVRSTGIVCVLTIHQPSAQLFHKLDDLLLLTNGKTAFYGTTKHAENYFSQIGFDVPERTNPADYYLDLIHADKETINRLRRADVTSTQNIDVFDWSSIYESSQNKWISSSSADRAILKPTERPSEQYRYYILTLNLIVYFWQERAIYIYRLFELIIIGIFTGTLFLREDKDLNNITNIAGALFFKCWVILFIAIAATPLFVRDRLTFENELLNNSYTALTYCLSLFTASIPYQLISAIIFEAFVWFLIGFNDKAERYVFSVLSTFSLLLLMESISLLTVHCLKNAMLSTTFAMVVLGNFFLFPGFFIPIHSMPRSIFWVAYLMPTKYDFDSQLYNIFHDQTYADGLGNNVPGDQVLSDFFFLNLNYNKWVDWFIVMMYMATFRTMHYMLIVWRYQSYGNIKDMTVQTMLDKLSSSTTTTVYTAVKKEADKDQNIVVSTQETSP